MEQHQWRRIVRDAFLIIVGSAIFAIGVDCFQIPNGLAAGGVTGLATIIHAVAGRMGIFIPVGFQTIIFNILLILLVFKTGNKHYIVRTIAGILASGIFTDILGPFLPVIGKGDLMFAALWGGVISGIGLGMVFRSGGNTGGTDILVQLLSDKTHIPIGLSILIVDGIIIGMSIPVFSLENGLYAIICLLVCSKAIDMVVDGPRTERAAYIISQEHEKIANKILYDMNRGCTELQARGVWSGNPKPVLLCILSRSETVRLKEIVSDCDEEAIVIISEVTEAFGEGFKKLGGTF